MFKKFICWLKGHDNLEHEPFGLAKLLGHKECTCRRCGLYSLDMAANPSVVGGVDRRPGCWGA